MNIIKKLAWGTSLLTSALIFSACGSSDDTTGSPGTSSAETLSSSDLMLSSSEAEFSSGNLSSESSSSSQISAPSNPFEIASRLGLGVNLGNHFEGETWGAWGENLQDDTFEKIAGLGFKHVRIPVRWDSYTSKTEPFEVEADRLDSMLAVVQKANEAGLMVILNQHHHAPIYEDPEAETPRFLAIWEQVATKMQDEGDYLLFEILNEPVDNLDNDAWHVLFPQAIATIRQSNPNRTLVLGGVDWNSISGMRSLSLPTTETNLIATFHFYDPHQFTHQGASWSSTTADEWLGTTWEGKENEQEDIRAALTSAASWGDAHDIPVYLGEYGAYEKADSTSRALWTEYVSTKATELEIPCAYWEWSSGFGIYNDGMDFYRQYLVDAIFNPEIDWENWPPRPDLSEEPYILLDDFEDSEGDSPLTTALGAAYSMQEYSLSDSTVSSWYYYRSDSSNWTNSLGDTLWMTDEIEEDGAEDNRTTMISENGYEGKGIEMAVHLWGKSYPWAGIGTNLDPKCDSCYIDFSDFTALTFLGQRRRHFSGKDHYSGER
jgi:aryl-phospho-beta-D-glucosidase BglC (GH1 family)